MVLPLYANLVRLDPTLLEAAADLDCRSFKALWSVTLTLSMPGVIAGSMLVFIPAVGEFVIPDLLGDPDSLMICKVLWSEFFNNRDWPLAVTLSLDDLVIASFAAGPGATTLPMAVYSSVRLGVCPQINALASLIVVVVTLGHPDFRRDPAAGATQTLPRA